MRTAKLANAVLDLSSAARRLLDLLPELEERRGQEETIESVYGKPFEELKAPAGWQFMMRAGKPVFRVAERGEWALAYPSFCNVYQSGHSHCAVRRIDDHKRLILEPADPPKRRWVFEEADEKRTIAPGEYYLNGNLIDYWMWSKWGSTKDSYTPLRLVEWPRQTQP